VVARLAWLKPACSGTVCARTGNGGSGSHPCWSLLGWVSWFLVDQFRATMATLGTDARLEFTLWGALLFWLVWVALPVVIFPLDENLDPAQFSFAPIGPGQLVAGLAISALIAPSVVIPLIVLGADIVEFAAVLPAACCPRFFSSRSSSSPARSSRR
jgi:hypothetical protein